MEFWKILILSSFFELRRARSTLYYLNLSRLAHLRARNRMTSFAPRSGEEIPPLIKGDGFSAKNFQFSNFLRVIRLYFIRMFAEKVNEGLAIDSARFRAYSAKKCEFLIFKLFAWGLELKFVPNLIYVLFPRILNRL